MATEPISRLAERFQQLVAARRSWEPLWEDCYAFALPYRNSFDRSAGGARFKTDRLFDGTAPDAVDQLAASLLAQLTPPWSRWFGLSAGEDLPPEETPVIARELDVISATLQAHLDRSNFTVEIHQCFLDLVVGGTASLLFEEAAPGSESAFRFRAVPLDQLYVDESADGHLSTTFRRNRLSLAAFRDRFPKVDLHTALGDLADSDNPLDTWIEVVEAVEPAGAKFRYTAFRPDGSSGSPVLLRTGEFSSAPFINFRWMKAPGDAWGRSPVMKTLPDIRTANKCVELVLKNASIAVTGIWQADDDGVINPANIRLTPGTIIPKAVGSAGLTPLEAPGRFDVSELVLNDLRARIRHALLADKLGQVDSPRMTATEVVERSAEMARILGATFGRLQSELLSPLIQRALAILRRRGEIPDIRIDGRTVDLRYRSPLARDQADQDVQALMTWLGMLQQMGPAALTAVDIPAAARWTGRALGVPADIIAADPMGSSAPLDTARADPATALQSLVANLTGPQTTAPTPASDNPAVLGARPPDGREAPALITPQPNGANP